MTWRRNASCSKGRLFATETRGCWQRAVQASGTHAVGSWTRSASGICSSVLVGVALRQAAKWLGALDDTDMFDKDVVIVRLLGMTSTASASQCCGCVVWNDLSR